MEGIVRDTVFQDILRLDS